MATTMVRWRAMRARLVRKAWAVVGRRVSAPLALGEAPSPLTVDGLQGCRIAHVRHDAGTVAPASCHVLGAGFESFRAFPDQTDVQLWSFTRGISFRAQHAVTDDGRVLTGPDDDFSRMWVAGRRIERGGRVLPGRCFYLSNSWVDNFYHWMVMTLPLLAHYRTVYGAGPVDWYYVGNGGLTAFQRETLKLAGVPHARVVLGPCRATEAVMAVRRYYSRAGLLFRTGAELDFLRGLVPCGETVRRRRLYVRRGTAKNRRAITNEAEILSFLASRGFEAAAMDGASIGEQAQMFRDAECIVAMHGAALANLAFARSGAQLVEIFPGDYREVSYFAAAAHRRLQYVALAAETSAEGACVRLSLLQAAIESITAGGELESATSLT